MHSFPTAGICGSLILLSSHVDLNKRQLRRFGSPLSLSCIHLEISLFQFSQAGKRGRQLNDQLKTKGTIHRRTGLDVKRKAGDIGFYTLRHYILGKEFYSKDWKFPSLIKEKFTMFPMQMAILIFMLLSHGKLTTIASWMCTIRLPFQHMDHLFTSKEFLRAGKAECVCRRK